MRRRLPMLRLALRLYAKRRSGSKDTCSMPLPIECQGVTSIIIRLPRILQFDSEEVVHSDYAISFDDLKPVLTLHKIKYFTLDINYPFSLDNQQLKEPAMAWPELEILDLGATHGWRKPSAITLPGLLPLFQHCPNLKQLGIAIDASHLTYELPTDGMQARNISCVEFSNSSIKAPAAVAAYLAYVMPQIREIYAWHTPTLQEYPEVDKYQPTALEPSWTDSSSDDEIEKT
ncbi:hypothetical protein SERLA73DRAFT_158438 [Serpula lacrymans var. lacrymans S7.3]|uniref:F-box domain-containing protein n=2 Tax=Serpula lacrymans var. lacrymans TaxID=341189 RepID=F8PIX9_SERL3|nr:uncharacterized protein SERLADRAFT_413244 [Serpula lacrymans var. lacrymans S7.9]EGO04079.1 hypothetical protein SERLA73DRAFT_158438 [Serpula lacrymans var. lacrymans S7.3]EGO29999.1 hypothetical protein SERLADRAFT_413244 [Serpula lacrymans var. lacrymans S7.9]